MPVLQRITTTYVETEDRIRLAGQCQDDQPVRLWLTRRLVERLLPLLFAWLDARAGAGAGALLMQEFAQDAARGALLPQAAVAPDAPCQVLVHAITVSRGVQAIGLALRATEAPADGPAWHISFEQERLRQWLGIVHAQYRKAGWPLDLWPAWIGAVSARPTTPLH